MRELTAEEKADYDRLTANTEQLTLDSVELGHLPGRVYGYARISTPKQKLERQIDNIKAVHPEAVIIREKYTGATTERPAWQKLARQLRAGDLIIFDEVSRMSRSAEEGAELYRSLYDRGIELEFIKEPYINTAVYRSATQRRISIATETGRDAIDKYLEGQEQLLNDLLFNLVQEQIALAFKSAERELELLHQRTSEGVRRAQAEGKQIGRPTGAKVDTAKAKQCRARILELSKTFQGTLKDEDCIKILGISKNSFYKYKKQISEGLYSPME